MSRKLLLIGAVTFLIGVGALVASFQIHSGEVPIQIVGAVLILISCILFGWHLCGGSKSKPKKKVLKTKNRMKKPKEISRNSYGHDNLGAQHDGGVSVIRPHGGSKRYNQGQRGQRSGNSGHQQQQHQQYQQQQYQHQQHQQQQYPQQIQLQQQQQYTQYNNGGGHGYVVSADGYVQSVSAGDGSVMGGQYTGGHPGGSLPLNNGVQINGSHSAGVHFNPGGRGSNLTGGVNSGFIRGSMDSINSANSHTGSQLSYDSDLSAGSLNTGRLRSSMKRASNKDTSSMGSTASKKSTRFAIVSEHTSV